jgi:hypothetical protein
MHYAKINICNDNALSSCGYTALKLTAKTTS